MKFNDYKKLLKKYYTGESSDIEKQWVEAWYDSFEGDRDAAKGFPNAEEKRCIKDRLTGRLAIHVQTSLPTRKRNIRRLRFWSRVAAAAIVILLCGTTWWVLYRPFDIPAHERYETDRYVQHFSVGPGARKTLKLSDGSMVRLNANSSLDIIAGYGDGKRLVRLDGEAFFQVKPAVKCPFFVETKDISVRVLGTSFNVKAYDHRKKVQIAVSTGKVQISDAIGPQKFLLHKGEKYDYDRTNRSFEKRNSGSDGAWLNNDVGLERVAFLDLALSFRDVYGIALISNDTTVLKSRYTLKLKYQRSAAQTAQLICHMLNKQYRKEENGGLTIF